MALAGDQDFDVDTFVEEFEELVALANEGKGMNHTEMVRCIGSCLKGARKQAYRVELRAARHDGRLKEAPEEVYRQIILRLQEFKEGLLEKQQRLNAEWRVLARGKRSALEFLPVFENTVAEMEMAGMGQIGS